MDNNIRNIIPKNTILFAGAGLSVNLGLPSWNDLINEMASMLGFDPDIFKSYGDHLMLAEYCKLECGGIGNLRSKMDTTWHSNEIDISTSKIHEYIVKSEFPIIYTTNFDKWIENSFDFHKVGYSKIVNASDLYGIDEKKTQIIKFHGDLTDDESLVITQSSYMDRLQFESPIDIKFRSDILHKPILFIGYSLSDINVRYIFHKLSKIKQRLPDNYRNISQNKSYIYMTCPNPIQEKIFERLGIIPIVSKTTNQKEDLESFLRTIYENGQNST